MVRGGRHRRPAGVPARRVQRRGRAGSGPRALRRPVRVYSPDRRGHGRSPDVEGPIDFDGAATDTIAFLQDVVGGPADLVGFSDGATTALHVALRRPDLVRRMVMISGQYHHEGLLPDLFGGDLDDAVAGMVQSPLAERYGRLSPDGAGHFPVVAEKVMRSAFEEPRLDVDELSR
ncbi:MAG: alpha/beta fold hydrolase, partial [Pseudonocardia sp.]